MAVPKQTRLHTFGRRIAEVELRRERKGRMGNIDRVRLDIPKFVAVAAKNALESLELRRFKNTPVYKALCSGLTRAYKIDVSLQLGMKPENARIMARELEAQETENHQHLMELYAWAFPKDKGKGFQGFSSQFWKTFNRNIELLYGGKREAMKESEQLVKRN